MDKIDYQYIDVDDNVGYVTAKHQNQIYFIHKYGGLLYLHWSDGTPLATDNNQLYKRIITGAVTIFENNNPKAKTNKK